MRAVDSRLVSSCYDLLRPLDGTGRSFFFTRILLLASTLLWSLLSSFRLLLCEAGPGGVVPHTGCGQEGWRLHVVLVRECVYEVGLAPWACLSSLVCPSTYRWDEQHFDYICFALFCLFLKGKLWRASSNRNAR